MSTLEVWFDGGCSLCRREIAWIRRLDRAGAIRFTDASTAEAESCPVDRAALLSRFHAREDGRLVHGAEAFAAMWRAVPVLRPLGLLARNPVVLRGLEAAYRRFLRVRPQVQRLVSRFDRGA